MLARDIAKYFIALVDEEAGDSISNLKLQKLLYYAQGFHLAIHDEPAFLEAIKAWMHGPVVPEVYHEYKEYGAGALPTQAINVEDYAPRLRDLLEEVYSVYGQFSASKLRNMTHDEPPYANTPQNGEISHDSMKQFFKTLIVEDEAQA